MKRPPASILRAAKFAFGRLYPLRNLVPPVLSKVAPPSSGTRFPALDGLRGLAVLAVMLNHTPIVGGRGFIIGSYGWHAVCIFFTLSAFLLYYPMTRPETKINLGSYYLRRFFRIYPAWIFATIFTLAIFYYCFGSTYGFNRIISHLTFAYSFQRDFIASIIAPAWTLAAEIQFYLLLPFLALLFVKRHIGWLIGIICLSAIAQYCLPFPQTKTPLIANWPYASTSFFIGMLAAWLVRNHPRICVSFAIPGIIGFILVRLLTLNLPYGNSALSLILDPPRQLFPSFFALLAICGLSTGKNTVTKLLSWLPIRFFGIIGYSIFYYISLSSGLCKKLPAL